MKFKPIAAIIFTLSFLFSASSFPMTQKDTSGVSSAVLPESQYEFSPVLEGTQIEHDFVIQNKGTEPLNIIRVKPG